ncbi:VirB3 family type IV secretion system protein [Geobacter grbiciae]|uniref:VirB3 family type IV secretion system protein n=1 Tax=Geobacter grbiciae TaxID=155042 RepID=UPI001C031CDD|nr:VirB3 family type IV secretion system protein [Geobacter grbiciae]MBT1077212.1 VirB3 family type IV secretion system protein [Geobacter grbiciae]
MSVSGFEVPIHRSLTEQIMIAGVPRNVAILNGTFVAALGLGLHSFLAIPLGLILHLLAYAATKKDPQFFDVFKRHIRQKNYYSA